MGFSISWVAIRGASRESILARLSLRPTGQREEIPESPTCGAELPNGWYLVFKNNDFSLVSQDGLLADLSRAGELILCYVEEHVMISGSEAWKNGLQIWWTRHESEKGLEHIVAKGSLPANYEAIRNKLLAELRADPEPCDYIFDLPIALAFAATGFRHNQYISDENKELYEVLV
jgi:hypothetical protein